MPMRMMTSRLPSAVTGAMAASQRRQVSPRKSSMGGSDSSKGRGFGMEGSGPYQPMADELITACTLLGVSRSDRDEEIAAFRPAFFNDLFPFGAPSFVGYACAGKMDDIIGLTDGIRVNETGVGVPAETLEALERPFEGTVDPRSGSSVRGLAGVVSGPAGRPTAQCGTG